MRINNRSICQTSIKFHKVFDRNSQAYQRMDKALVIDFLVF